MIERRKWTNRASIGWPPYLFMPDGKNVILWPSTDSSYRRENFGRSRPGPQLAALATGVVVASWNFVEMKGRRDAALSPDGEVVAVTGEGHERAFFYSTKTGEKLGEVPTAHEKIAYSPDGTLFLAGRLIFSTKSREVDNPTDADKLWQNR